ncbi:ABC-type multidrug transport system, ATPase component [Archaeoglobus sulfaticallidus PM70-1]|uniref:ABC-type multidrug transport system, ATPase component n=1 Tax=Archaeoglobus sulfaticallidus PM70-1 TaxID=387631 RepID=N0BE77_9EURY|nr:ABC transporter ATP-binding protein [Archaeoglobus sulfaticallidus]AGK60512.1 ABC-type multidrug transport system, ATPase component [Archaeoglobus sulfaticallidus PM70-1]
MGILEIENLTVRFGDFLAVKDFSLKVRRGEILGLLGPNGAGKTTTIRAIFGMVSYEGKIRINAGSIGWMPQNSPLYLNLTVEENMRFFTSLHGIRNAEQRIEELLRLVNLYDFRKRLVRNLSGGMKQRAMLACAMIHDPDLLILDEPTAGVDPPLRKTFWEHFEELNAEGKTILVTTHYMDEAENCDRIVLMRNGTKIAEGSPEDVKRWALGGEIVRIRVDDRQRAFRLLSSADYEVVVDDWVAVKTAMASPEVPRIVDLLKAGGVEVKEVETVKATLEEAFLRLVEG